MQQAVDNVNGESTVDLFLDGSRKSLLRKDNVSEQVELRINEIFAQADLNNDGCISYSEFIWAMTGLDASSFPSTPAGSSVQSKYSPNDKYSPKSTNANYDSPTRKTIASPGDANMRLVSSTKSGHTSWKLPPLDNQTQVNELRSKASRHTLQITTGNASPYRYKTPRSAVQDDDEDNDNENDVVQQAAQAPPNYKGILAINSFHQPFAKVSFYTRFHCVLTC